MKLVLISGPTGSGKTSLSRIILNELKNGIALSTDDYYKTGLLSDLLSIFIGCYYDRNISFNYKLLKKDINFICNNEKSDHSYFYDFKKKVKKKRYKKTLGIKYLIIEGIFVTELSNDLNKYECLFIKLKTNKESCMNRVISRDVKERGKNKNKAKRDFLNSWEFFHNKKRTNKATKNKKEIIYSRKEDLDLVIKGIINLTT